MTSADEPPTARGRRRTGCPTAAVRIPGQRQPAPGPATGAAGPDDVDEAAITRLAGAAVEAIAHGLAAGRDPAETVTRVLTTVFTGDGATEANEDLADPADVADRVLRIVRAAGC